MVRPNELVEAVLYTLQQSENIPDAAKFVGYEPDINSQPIKLPLIEVSLSTQFELNEENSDFVGYVTDSAGNQIGRKFESLYEQELTIAAWTVHDSSYDPREIGSVVRDEIYAHTTEGPNQPLRHPDDDRVLDEVWKITVTEGEHTDDLGTSPLLRRWEEIITISASEQYVTSEDTIEDYNLNAE